MKITILTLACCLSALCADAQPGCTDPQALNFDASATLNDGSCAYPPTSYFPALVAELPEFLQEASGLEFYDDQLWLQQDGGDGTLLYTLDTLTGAVLQTYPLPTLTNVDWEDLAEDATHLYIGDFGNNAGSRTDLRIYKISKNDLLAGTATAEAIDFSFSDQTDFTIANLATHHDCEAFFAHDDSLHLFSKDWLDLKTRHYVLPTTPGTHVAQLRDSLDVGGLVSGADISIDGHATLLCYNLSTAEVFVWLLFDFQGDQFFTGNKRKISLGTPLNIGKAEGIAFRNETEGYICSERYSIIPQRLHRFSIKQWVENPSPASVRLDDANVAASPNPFSDFLSVDFQQVVMEETTAILLSADGKIWQQTILRSEKNTLATAALPAGTYFLWVKNGSGSAVKKLVKH